MVLKKNILTPYVPGRVVDSASETLEEAFTNNTKVFVTRPDGKRVGFRFTPYKLHPFFPFWIPNFTPDPGVTDVLEVDENVLFNSGSSFWELFEPFNPSQYYLTTREKVRYTIDEVTGLLQARDANFNTLTFTNGAITHSSGAAITIEHDSDGRVTKITDLAGKDIEYTYDLNGDLVAVKNQIGEQTSYSYQAGHYLKTITLNDGTVVLENIYSPDDRLIKQIDGEGHEINIGINLDALTENVQDRNGNITVLKYDPNGNLIQKVEPSGATWSYSYDANYNQTSVTNPLGHTTTRVFDAQSRMLSETDALGNTRSYTYNEWGQVLSATAPGGAILSSTYDATGNLTHIVDFSGRQKNFAYNTAGLIGSIANGVGATSTISYDSLGNPTTGIDALGNQSNLVFDSNGNLIQRTAIRTDSSNQQHTVVESYVYDDLNRVVQSTDGEGRAVYVEWNTWNKPTLFRDKRGIETTFEYDGNGLLIKINRPDGTTELFTYDAEFNRTSETDRRGHTTTYTYDDLNRLKTAIYADGTVRSYAYDSVGNLIAETDQLGRVTQYGYDALNRRITVTDPLGGVTQMAYDEFNHLTEQVDASGRHTSYDFDPAGHLLQVMFPDLTTNLLTYDAEGREISVTDARGNTTHTIYDLLGRAVQTIDESGAITQSVYDELGNRIREIDPLGSTTLFDFNNVGLLKKRTSATGAVELMTYDGNDNNITRADPNGRVTTNVYDVNDRLSTSSLPGGVTTTITYDANGNRASIADPLGQVTTFTYDVRDRETSRTDPIGKISQLLYDGVGNVTEEIDRLGRHKVHSYDALNRRIQEKWITAGTVVRTRNFGFDLLGNLISESDGISSYSYTYDNRDRVKTIDTLGTVGLPRLILTKSYDPEGNVTQVVDNLGLSLEALFDSRGYLAMKRWQGGDVTPLRTEFSYNSRGDLSNMLRFNAVTGGDTIASTTRTIDADRRELTRKHSTGDGTTVAEYAYGYNAGSELVSSNDHGELTGYSYDNKGQLVSADHSLIPDETFQYDANGNRTGGDYVVGPNNRIIADDTFDYLYDDEGNIIRRTRRADGEYTVFSYDHSNALTSAIRHAMGGAVISTVDFVYDVRGRRMGKVVDGVASYSHYLDDHVWADFDSSQQITSRYMFGDRIDSILARNRLGEGAQLYLSDRLGSVMDRVSISGATTNTLQYRAFGGVASESGTGDRYKFTGRELDSETGLYYYRARYYDPKLGRFMSEDPLRFDAGDTNLYRYVGNGPGNGVDPSGMFVDSYGTYRVAITVAASQAYQISARQIIIGALLRPVVIKTLIAAVGVAGTVTYVRYYTQDEGNRLGLTAELRTIFGLQAAVFLTPDASNTTTTTLPDGTEITKTEEEIEEKFFIGQETVTKKRTCSDDHFFDLRRKKTRYCDVKQCKSYHTTVELMSTIQSLEKCLQIRQQITNDCYGGIPEPGHTQQEKQKRQQLSDCKEWLNAIR